jgi:hypothetical protein
MKDMAFGVGSVQVAALLLAAGLGTAALAAQPSAGQEGVPLVRQGASDYVVVLSRDASPSEQWAAQDFVAHVKQMSGAELKVQAEADAVPERAVLIGDSKAVSALGVRVDAARLGDDGFVIRTVGPRLVIAGGRLRGTMYGVYMVLETLGCRWWYPGASTVPQAKDVTVPPMDEQQVPAMEYRDMLYGEMDDSDDAMLWRARNKVNGGFYKSMKPEYGGAWTFDTLVHSYGRLMPAEQYFNEHPEYFALRGGRRVSSQPDFSNPQVVRIMADTILKELAEHPEWRHVTIGQNDNNSYCECDGCKALAEKYGTPGGAQLHFAKEVSEIVRQKYPDIWINVPAYHWSRKPPQGIVPDQKGIMTLCSIECNFGQPLEEGYPQANADFKADIVGWAELAPKLYIWDYTTNFSHYILPYPNYYVLAPNVKFFVEHKVRGYMAQGSHTTRHGQFAPLCMWVLAKALWNPDADGRKLVEEFCLGYYGPQAGKLVLEYANLLHEAIAKDRIPLWCSRRTTLTAPYLSPELIARGDHLFRQAEQAVKDSPELLQRVQADHVPLLYVMVRRAGEMMPAAVSLTPGLTAAQVYTEFAEYGKAAGISRIAEGGSAAELFDWAADYGRLKAQDPKSDLPAELKDKDPATYRLLHAADLGERVTSLTKVAGATDGWALALAAPGRGVMYRFNAPWDFQEGKAYRLFIRAKATVGPEAGDAALTAGIQVPEPLPQTCRRTIKPQELNGQWQVFDVGPWKPTNEGGSFTISAGRSGITDAFIDCLWLAEAPAAGPAAP